MLHCRKDICNGSRMMAQERGTEKGTCGIKVEVRTAERIGKVSQRRKIEQLATHLRRQEREMIPLSFRKRLEESRILI